MTPSTPDLKSLFLQALEQPPGLERSAYLDGACRGDGQLRGRIDELIEHYLRASECFGGATDVAAGVRSTDKAPRPRGAVTVTCAAGLPTLPRAFDEGPGTQLGPYVLLQKIGEGGMGTVYMAEQEHPIRRKVALKVIKPGMDTDRVVARFEAERQALALMDHPSIARVFDAGATESGRPYFVMELVDGVPINRYCDQARLSMRERLSLFLPVCHAIQHAHQKGIIHRDIKPSNVLIALVDGQPVDGADPHGPRRPRLDRAQARREGSEPAIRDGRRPGAGRPAVPGWGPGRGVPAVDDLSLPQVFPEAPGGPDHGVGIRRGARDDVGGEHLAGDPGAGGVTNGSAVVPVTLDLAHGVTLTVTAGGHTATSGTITVAPGAAYSFAVVAPSSVTVGDTFNVTVTPKDRFGNTTTIGVPYSAVTATNGMTVNGERGTFADPAESLTNATVGLQTAAKSVSITFNAGSVHGTSSTITVNPDWFSENLSDPWVQETARAEYKANGGLTYNAWLQVFTTVEDHYSSLPSSAMSSLQVLLNNAAFLNSPASDTDLTSKVIAGDPDNATYNSLNSQDVVVTTNLGNLAVNSSTSQLKELVNKWFLGVNYPSSTYGTGPGGAAPNATPSYQLVSNVPLFASGESSSKVEYYDVQQGQIGDCWVLASLAAVADREPQAIWSMITPNGNATYTVRFIEPSGTPDYVTVNDELPSGGSIFASVTHANPGTSNSSELWVALIEKAYAQENSEGWLPSNNPGSDSYQAINYIFSNDGPAYGTVGVLSAITGSPTSSPGVNPGTLGSDWLNGDSVVLGTPDSPQVSIDGVNIVEGHVYAVIGYAPATSSAPAQFTLFSPWGLNGVSYTPAGFTTSVFCAGIATANPSQVSAAFIFGTESGAAAPLRTRWNSPTTPSIWCWTVRTTIRPASRTAHVR